MILIAYGCSLYSARVQSFIISPSPGPGNVRAEFLAYVTESLTRGPGMYIIYMIGDEDGYDDDDDGDDVMTILSSPQGSWAPYMLKICMIFT